MSSLALYIATVGPTGYARIAPGTAGSAFGLGLYLAMHYLGIDWKVQLGVTIAVIVIGTWAGAEAARHFQQDDPSYVVIDEVAGQLVTLVLTGAKLQGALLGFVLFRALDVIKPPPSNHFERMHGGVGIMADDVAAGLYAMAGVTVLAAVGWLPG